MTSGRPPKLKPVDQHHIRFNEEEKTILMEMGPGKTGDKIKYLIKKEGERRHQNNPSSKIEMLSKWERERKEAMKFNARTNENRKKLLSMGFTEEELEKAEEGDKII